MLFDTDAFCKLGVARLLYETIATFGVTIKECGRLPALPYMLKRGRLRRNLGDVNSEYLIRLADEMPSIPEPTGRWLALLTGQSSIDPGEALLLAMAAEQSCFVITGDKRALVGVKELPEFSAALDGRVVVLEAVMATLCRMLGEDALRARVMPIGNIDAAIRVCFSDPGASPLVGLGSYFDELAENLYPLKLWSPWLP